MAPTSSMHCPATGRSEHPEHAEHPEHPEHPEHAEHAATPSRTAPRVWHRLARSMTAAAWLVSLAACDPLGLYDRLQPRETDKARATREEQERGRSRPNAQRAGSTSSVTSAPPGGARPTLPATLQTTAASPVTTTPPAASPAPSSLLESPTAAVRALEAKVGGGPVRALELVVYPGYAKLQAQSPKNPAHVDEYTWRGGVDEPTPVMLSGKPTQAELDASLFRLDEIDLGRLPMMVADTKARLAYEGGEITHAILERNLPFSKAVQWHVHMASERESGFVAYDVAGKVVRVHK